VQATAVLGKTINPRFVAKLQKDIDKAWADEAVIFVMLDPDPDPHAARHGKPHHIDTAVGVLRSTLRRSLGERVVPVWLPRGHDPGDMDRDIMQKMIREAAGKLGLPVSFSAAGRKPAVLEALPQ
jgi:hypothetical protein